MKLTKYEHACFTLEKDGKLIVVDPGDWTTDFIMPENVIAIVITHSHPDHCDPTIVRKIITSNPKTQVYAHSDIIRKLGSSIESRPVVAGDQIEVGPFQLAFFGGKHALIHSDIPQITNLGVMVNNSLYYPGDSFDAPDRPVKVLALPVSAPWMRLSEAMDFCKEVNAELVFPTHDAILSKTGKQLVDRMLKPYSNAYARLTESIEIDG
ncbi:MAG: MBL fold metallo-hydrolase [Candidatus Saccharimonas sp.]